jgi:hypothetical protein
LIGLCLAMSACGSGDDGAATSVRPFREIQDGAISFEGDPNDPTRGIFRVTTTEPMICAIVWGEDSSFGRFNNSQSMNGTGIIDHDVLLPDVEPGMEYRYIVQGTTADGTLYRSEEATFVIEPSSDGADDSAALGENLATGAEVTEVSSAFSPSFGGELAVDGDLATEWSSGGDGDGEFIEIDLGERIGFDAIEFVTRAMTDGTSVTETFTVAVDGGEPLGPFPASTPASRRPAMIDRITGQTLRFVVATSTGGNVGAVELGVYRT